MKILPLLTIATALLSAAPALAVDTDYTFSGVVEGTSTFDGTFTLNSGDGAYGLSAFSASYNGATYNLQNSGIRHSNGRIYLGASPMGVSDLSPGFDDFLIEEFNPTKIDIASPVSVNAVLTTKGSTAFRNFSVTIGRAVTIQQGSAGAVPEPATWAMMLVGFGMIGAAARYRRRPSRIVYA